MANGGDHFSIDEENPAVPPPPPSGGGTNLTEETQSLINSFRSVPLTPQERQTQEQSLFNLMTRNSEGEGEVSSQFTQMIPRLHERELQRMVKLLTSYTDYFLPIARNKNGSKRLQELLGKSDHLDTFFADAILRCFVRVMTDKQASRVVIQGIRVFKERNKETMYYHIIHHAIQLARKTYGSIALQKIITDDVDYFNCNLLIDKVVLNALCLSNDVDGNCLVQEVLQLKDQRWTYNIAFNLEGHFVELSSWKQGSYLVEKLLDTEESMDVVDLVLEEILQCEEDRLMRLARNTSGSFVVRKALRIAEEKFRFDLLCTSLGKNIAEFLDSAYD